MSGFYMRVLASDHVFYQGRVEAVTLPGVEENWHEAIVGLGFAEMINNRLTILVDTAERPEDIDRKRAEEAKARAEEQLRQKQSMQEYYMSKASLARAMTRLSATNKKNIV